ncbi:MAG: two-component regulator propeller domain-containing protein [Bacteroidota bacterium]
MTIDLIKAVLIFLISVNFFSCTGQVGQESQSVDSEKTTLGKTVLELDQQIWSIFQDSKRNHWFGSRQKGLYRFDGKTLTQFTVEDGLADSRVSGIQEYENGQLLIQTVKGISKFDGNRFTTLSVMESSKNEWKLEKNDLWFSYGEDRVCRYDGEHLYALDLPKQDIEKAFGIKGDNPSYSPYAVSGIGKDKSGNIWFGTGIAGAFRFDGQSFLWIGEKELSTLEDGREPGVRSIVEDQDSNIWLSHTLYKYAITSESTYEKLPGIDLSKQAVSIELPYYLSAVVDDENKLWMVSFDQGIWQYDGETLTQFFLKNGPKNVSLLMIFKDRDGVLWIGTHNDGVYRYNGVRFDKFGL